MFLWDVVPGYDRIDIGFGWSRGVRLGSCEQIPCACVMLGTVVHMTSTVLCVVSGWQNRIHVFANMRIGPFFVPGFSC